MAPASVASANVDGQTLASKFVTQGPTPRSATYHAPPLQKTTRLQRDCQLEPYSQKALPVHGSPADGAVSGHGREASTLASPGPISLEAFPPHPTTRRGEARKTLRFMGLLVGIEPDAHRMLVQLWIGLGRTASATRIRPCSVERCAVALVRTSLEWN
jgi:hypothetical protein